MCLIFSSFCYTLNNLQNRRQHESFLCCIFAWILETFVISNLLSFFWQSIFISCWKTFTTMVFLTFHSSNGCYSIGRKGTCIELCTYSLQRELYSFNIIPIAVLFVLAARNHFFCTFFWTIGCHDIKFIFSLLHWGLLHSCKNLYINSWWLVIFFWWTVQFFFGLSCISFKTELSTNFLL